MRKGGKAVTNPSAPRTVRTIDLAIGNGRLVAPARPPFQGAEFLTPPVDRRVELRCYMRDPDSHLIEVGQATALEWRTG
jgi:hypothetical protein